MQGRPIADHAQSGRLDLFQRERLSSADEAPGLAPQRQSELLHSVTK
jgi:hypothetical protein